MHLHRQRHARAARVRSTETKEVWPFKGERIARALRQDARAHEASYASLVWQAVALAGWLLGACAISVTPTQARAIAIKASRIATKNVANIALYLNAAAAMCALRRGTASDSAVP